MSERQAVLDEEESLPGTFLDADEDETDEVQIIWVMAGDDLAPGQVGIVEEDPAHPGGIARIVKGDPQFNAGEVAETTTVQQKLAHRELKRMGTRDVKRHLASADAFGKSEAARVQRERALAASQRAARGEPHAQPLTAQAGPAANPEDERAVREALSEAVGRATTAEAEVKRLSAQLETLTARVGELERQNDEVWARFDEEENGDGPAGPTGSTGAMGARGTTGTKKAGT